MARLRLAICLTIIIIASIPALANGPRIIVADSITRSYLPRASVFDRYGCPLGMSDKKGRLPIIPEGYFPLTVRYLGFEDKIVPNALIDTVFMHEAYTELPEFILDSDNKKILHMLAYVREYSTMTTYSDTVFLFREKMVDFMVNKDNKGKFRGWLKPRVLSSQSYYRFTDNIGTDSVSDESNYHFSWSDWMGIAPEKQLPVKLLGKEEADATIFGKYSATETWSKQKDKISVNVDVLADTLSRQWVPGLYAFFHRDENLDRFVDFEQIKLRFDFENVTGETVSPENLEFYSYNIESAGRGHGMFRFNKKEQRFFVSTSAVVYILDKEYISVKEAKKWESRNIAIDDKTIYSPLTAPELSASIEALIERVEAIDKEKVRQDLPPDYKLVGADLSRKNFRIGHRLLSAIKALTGITLYKSRKKLKNDWRAFRKKQLEHNSERVIEDL